MRASIIGFLLGSLCLAFSPWLVPLWLCPVLLLGGCLLLCFRSPLWPAACGVLAALLTGSLRGEALLQATLDPHCNRVPISVTGQVISLPRSSLVSPGRLRQRFEFRVASLQPAHCRGPRKLLLSYYGQQRLLPGVQQRFQVTLRRPWGLANPGSFNMQGWFAVTGIHAVGTVRGDGQPLAAVDHSFRQIHHQLRQRISAAIGEAGLSPQADAVLRALSVADKSGLDYHLWRLFQQYGLNHLLVISGLHVAMVAGLALLAGRVLHGALSRLFGRAVRWPLPELLAMLSALAYAAMAGFSVATVRALTMLGCFLFASMLGRSTGGFNNLLLAACLLLLSNPLVVVGSGFWLSFGAVAGLLWMACWQVHGSAMRLWIKPHLFMAALMVPLGGLWFGGSSWVSAPANALMVPLVGFLVVPLTLLGALLSFIDVELARGCWQLAALPLDSLYQPAMAVADQHRLFLPFSPGVPALVLAAVAACLLLVPLAGRYRWCLLILLLPLFLGRSPSEGRPRLEVLDVGQGTAVVFTAMGRTLLYDTGGGEPGGPNMANSVIIPWLRASAVTSLQTLVVSHDDRDHSAGAADILRALPVGQVLVGESPLPLSQPCRSGLAWQWPGNIRFRVLAPGADEEGNEASCVLQIHTPGMRLLLAGDIGVSQERELIRYWGPQLRSDVLLVGHHGSATSSSQAWLNHVAPRLAVITAGYASRFGHPHGDVLARLRRQGIRVAETAHEGALSLSLDEHGGVSMSTYRAGYQPWWM